jgi:DNA-3-methyladenine glycosylase II
MGSSILALMPSKKPGMDKRVVAALAHLKTADPVLYAHARALKDHLVPRATGRYSSQELFASLAASVTGQQLSTKAADTIWARLEAACGGSVTPEAIKKLRLSTMRKAGLSAAKAKTLKELAHAVLKGVLDLPALRKVPEEEAIAKLSSIWGIGRWTAEMFLMFALEREDVFSPGDLGLRRSMESLYGLPKDVHIKELEIIALKWSPHRTFASRTLWRIRDSS